MEIAPTPTSHRSKMLITPSSHRAEIQAAFAPRVMMEVEYDGDKVVVGYEQRTLATVRVLCVLTGTIFHGFPLFFEQLIVAVIFVVVYLLTVHKGMLQCTNVDGMLKLSQVASALAVFLLGFYTSSSLARWWRLRTEGVGNIWAASSELCMAVSQWANPGAEVLASIRRYARASLMFVFMKHRGQLQHLELLSEREVLTEAEINNINLWNNNLSESMWAWIYAVVMKLHKDGKIKSEYVLCQVLESVKKGRSGAAVIGSQLGTPLPVQYVHILGFMVKLQNVFTAYAYGIKAACGSGDDPVWQEFCLAFLPALLYNSVLMINAKLANPFALGRLSFPEARYDKGIESDGLSYIQAFENTPAWLRDGVV